MLITYLQRIFIQIDRIMLKKIVLQTTKPLISDDDDDTELTAGMLSDSVV